MKVRFARFCEAKLTVFFFLLLLLLLQVFEVSVQVDAGGGCMACGGAPGDLLGMAPVFRQSDTADSCQHRKKVRREFDRPIYLSIYLSIDRYRERCCSL